MRNVIKGIFGVFKKRFQILDKVPSYSFDVQVKLILLLVALDDFTRYRANGLEDAKYAEADADNKARNLEQSQHQGCGNQVRTTSRETAPTEDRNRAELQEKIASEMWNDYKIYVGRRNGMIRE